MVFLIEKIKGSWFWRLRSYKKIVGSSHGCATKQECLEEVAAIIKQGAAEATIQMAEGGFVDARASSRPRLTQILSVRRKRFSPCGRP